MKLIRLYLDDASLGCGFYQVLLVKEGSKFDHLLYVPTLKHIKLPVEERARQQRRGLVTEYPFKAAAVKRAIKAKRQQWEKYSFQTPGAFIDETLSSLKESLL